MGDSINKLVDVILKAIDTRQAKKPKGYTTQAKVLRVTDGTAWVHIPGGADETPVQETIACKAGDTVQVHVENGTATLTGNSSAPPTDDTTANAAAQVAEKGLKKADGLSQFFWFMNGNSDEAGAHVTEIPGEEFLRGPRGGNLLLRSNTVRIRLGKQILSELSANKMTLASGKAAVKYSEDGSAFGLQDSHRVVVCKSTDEAGVRNDATLSSRDVAGFDINSTPMAFFNATHKTDNGVKHYAASMYAFDGEGGFWAVVLGKDGLLQNTGGFSIWAPGGINKFNLADYAVLENNVADHNDIFHNLPGLFAVETYTLTMSTSALAAGGHLEYSETKTKAGYYPLNVAGFHSNKQATTVRSCYIDEVAEGTCKVHIHVRNDTSSSASANITADVMVLWIKISA